MDIEQLMCRTLRLGMSDGTFLKIEYVYGFELFNTRPYHCYETWCGGWEITDERNAIKIRDEKLESGLKRWAEKAGPIIDAKRAAEKEARNVNAQAD
jgi:hypothetical protein